MTVCRSKAWDERVLRSAWWVHASQVSKTAPSGQYLSTGSFIIRGKKNPLTPHRLEMGLGILFCVKRESHDDDCDDAIERNETVVVEKEKSEVHTTLEDVLETFVLTTKTTTTTTNSTDTESGSNQIKKEEKEKIIEEDEREETQKNQLKRGKRSKMKRAKKKYKDQDEHDYRIAMASLQGRKKFVEYEKRFEGKIKSTTKEKANEKNRTERQHRPQTQEVQDQPHYVKEREEVIEDSHAEVLELVSSPSKEQLLSSYMCVPVVAPFGALKDYMYKIKITPGKMKRGKCAKEAIASFLLTKKDEHTSRLISDIPTQDVINAMLANSQVSASSSNKKNKGKKSGRKGRGKK